MDKWRGWNVNNTLRKIYNTHNDALSKAESINNQFDHRQNTKDSFDIIGIGEPSLQAMDKLQRYIIEKNRSLLHLALVKKVKVKIVSTFDASNNLQNVLQIRTSVQTYEKLRSMYKVYLFRAKLKQLNSGEKQKKVFRKVMTEQKIQSTDDEKKTLSTVQIRDFYITGSSTTCVNALYKLYRHIDPTNYEYSSNYKLEEAYDDRLQKTIMRIVDCRTTLCIHTSARNFAKLYDQYKIYCQETRKPEKLESSLRTKKQKKKKK